MSARNKAGKKKKTRVQENGVRKNRRKMKKECATIHFIARNPHEAQTRQFLSQWINKEQILALRELVVNDLAQNLPDARSGKGKVKLMKSVKLRAQRFARGELKKRNLHHLYPLLKRLCQNALSHHGLCN